MSELNIEVLNSAVMFLLRTECKQTCKTGRLEKLTDPTYCNGCEVRKQIKALEEYAND